jgi:hypothetical protein
VDFHLKFTPNQIVDAEEIAFVQAVTSLVNEQPFAVNPTAGARSIPQGDPGEGMHIDVGQSRKSPFITDQTGVHYQDKTHAYSRDAEMFDNPGFPIKDTDSAEMTFTTSVTATKGTQAGAYYGGVRWGWRREPKQKPKKMPLTAEPGNVPGGSLFKTIAVLWDKSKTSGQLPTEHLPTVAVKYTTRSTRVVLDPAKPKARGSFDLSAGTQVEVLEAVHPTTAGFQRIIVTAGSHRGKMGWITEALSDTEPLKPKAKRR